MTRQPSPELQALDRRQPRRHGDEFGVGTVLQQWPHGLEEGHGREGVDFKVHFVFVDGGCYCRAVVFPDSGVGDYDVDGVDGVVGLEDFGCVVGVGVGEAVDFDDDEGGVLAGREFVQGLSCFVMGVADCGYDCGVGSLEQGSDEAEADAAVCTSYQIGKSRSRRCGLRGGRRFFAGQFGEDLEAHLINSEG